MATPSSAARRGRSCAGPQIMSQPLLKKSRTKFVGRYKTGVLGVKSNYQNAELE